jgi:hypothetical protein
MHTTLFRHRFIVLIIALAIVQFASAEEATGPRQVLPEGAKRSAQLSTEGVSAYVRDRTLWLQLDSNVAQSGKTAIPRLCAPIRSLHWKDDGDAELGCLPEPQQWIFSWQTAPAESPVIEVVFDSTPLLPADCPAASPAGDGSIMLHAYQASTFGEKLRFEPQWYKNTVGYWTIASDYATWELTIDQPGSYSVAVLQGCGKGQGGSDALITLRQGDQVKAELSFQTIDTGHFQNFRWHHLGAVNLTASGPYQLRLVARRIAKAALFDVRTIHLVRQAKRSE